MPNQINSKNTPKAYDAGDMSDAYSLAESDMQWMSTAISHARKEVKRLNALAENGELITEHHFFELISHLDMYEYLADDCRNYHAKEAESYSAEWEANKKAVAL